MISIPGKIPIRIFPVFWLLIIVIGWLNSATVMGTLIWSLVMLFSILVHEFGHALTALFFGQKAEIDLVGLGGLTRREGSRPKLWQEFLIVLNGPFAGFILFFLTYLIQPFFVSEHFKLITYALEVSIYVNLFWNILNLLPILPLDGGHLLKIILEGLFGFKGLKIALIISMAFSIIIGLILFLVQAFLGGSLFLLLAFESYRTWSEVKNVTSQDSDIHLKNLLNEAQEDLKNGLHSEALSKFLLLREQAKDGVLYVIATQYIARLLAEQGHFKQAYDWLLPLSNRLAPDYLRLLQQLAYQLQEWEQAVKIGKQAYQESPLADVALINAFCYAIMGHATPAVGWLRCAVQSGLKDTSQILKRREFDVIRESSEFKALASRLS